MKASSTTWRGPVRRSGWRRIHTKIRRSAWRTGFCETTGSAPAWIEEGKEIDAEVGRLRADRNRLGEDEFRRRVAALNRRIEIYNLKTPVAMAQRTKIRADRS